MGIPIEVSEVKSNCMHVEKQRLCAKCWESYMYKSINF